MMDESGATDRRGPPALVRVVVIVLVAGISMELSQPAPEAVPSPTASPTASRAASPTTSPTTSRAVGPAANPAANPAIDRALDEKPSLASGAHAGVREKDLIRGIVIGIARELLGAGDRRIDAATALGAGGLGADDLDFVELVMTLEDVFEIEIRDEEIAGEIRTVGDLVGIVVKKQRVR